MKITLAFFAAILCAGAPGLQNAYEDGCYGMSGMKVNIIADNCQDLARCSNCGLASYQNSAGVHGEDQDASSMWTLETVNGNKCALKADTGYYAGRCHDCWKSAAYSESLFVHVTNPSTALYAQWTMEKHGRLFAFKSDTGKYMARCNGCVSGGNKDNFAFVNADSPTTIALWDVKSVKNDGCLGMSGKQVYIISDIGGYLARCSACGQGIYENSVQVQGQAGDKFAMWTLESVGNKCALKSDIGAYAARCRGCWNGGPYNYPDSVFDQGKNPHTEVFAQWTMRRHGDRISFQSDIGKYMARCFGCVPGGTKDNFAYLQVDSLENAPFALWKVVLV